ncbi:hypothetical protein DNFV4_01976 [Nitrospira tepida]|uniref:Lipoprotein n=1 Tax=Nitrospira tepida TaxID=2973512 RepID=A0AA86MYQ6_9BACT|nr:hypothetical protein [Nitrospira tepida]CAI4031557.1 hypothetical protein DNFV4_01976 [Nitrospira tepida]
MKGRELAQGGMNRRMTCAAIGVFVFAMAAVGCARLPYTTQTIHEDQRVVVTLQREIDAPAYTHPVQISDQDLSAILRGFSLRKQQRLPLRWFAEEVPPTPLFREDELAVLAGPLAKGLRKAGPNERVHFELRAPGNNPHDEWDTTAGWIAVREPSLRLEVDYHHVQTPRQKSSPYDYNYPTPPPTKSEYLLYFEPGRFWGTAPGFEKPVLQYRDFLRSAPIVPMK